MASKKACVCICIIFAVLVVAFVITVTITDNIIPPEKIAIINANLNRFELAVGSTTSLYYDLTFIMSIHKTVWHNYNANYQDMEVDCYYSNQQFDWLVFGDFGLTSRKSFFNFTRTGNSTINLGSSDVEHFKKSNETGFFDLTICLQGIRPYWSEEGETHDPLFYQCKLNLQLITAQNNSTESGDFQQVKCR